LCIRAWLQLYLTYPVYLGITQAFLVMAMRRDLVSAVDANDIMTQFCHSGRYHDDNAEHLKSSFVI
jgi:hypothetical protein